MCSWKPIGLDAIFRKLDFIISSAYNFNFLVKTICKYKIRTVITDDIVVKFVLVNKLNQGNNISYTKYKNKTYKKYIYRHDISCLYKVSLGTNQVLSGIN